MAIQRDKAIKFFFPAKNITIKERRRLKIFLNSLIIKEGKQLGYINYIFCPDKYLLSINKKYLKHEYYTDIITFDLSVGGKHLEAEIYISIDRVRDNAEKFGANIKDELLRVMFHGVLHLCGYDDKTSKAQKIMRERETYYLNEYKDN